MYVFPSVFLVCSVFIKSYQLSLRKQSEVNSLSRVQLFVTLWTVAPHAPLSMGILQARTLEWVAISFSKGSSWPMDQTQVSHIAGRLFTLWATREAQRKQTFVFLCI